MTEKDIDQRLEKIEKESADIMGLFDNSGHIPAQYIDKAQVLFKNLKDALQSEYKRMDTVRFQSSMSEIESAFYHPAIRDSWANTGVSRVRWDSRPDSRWFSVLYDVHGYMRYWRDQLSSRNAA